MHVTYEHMATTQQERAARLGLRLENFNSGIPNSINGWRVFRGTAQRDYFCGKHLAHYRDGAEMVAFLDGFEMTLSGGLQQ